MTVTVHVAAGAPVAGAVQVVVRKGGKAVLTRTVALTDGSGSVQLTLHRKGRYQLAATYVGSTSVVGSSAEVALRVRRAGR